MSAVTSVQGNATAALAAIQKTQAANKPETVTQEATETAAVTKAEAAKGDQRAARKLAQEQAQTETASTSQKAEPPKPLTPGNVNLTA